MKSLVILVTLVTELIVNCLAVTIVGRFVTFVTKFRSLISFVIACLVTLGHGLSQFVTVLEIVKFC